MKKRVLILILLSLLFLVLPFNFVSGNPTYEDFSTYGEIESFSYNHTGFWKKFNAHTVWDLEYNSGSGWNSIKSDLDIIKNQSGGVCKIALNFTASFDADYRLTFGIDLDVKEYFHKVGSFNYTIIYKNYTAVFDWIDLKNFTSLILSHGVKSIDSESWFWFRIRKNNVPLGKNVYLDPSLEDFTDYEEVDPNNHINLVGTNHIDATVKRNENAYLYYDKGVDYFSDFVHFLDFKCQDVSTYALTAIWMLTNDVGSLSELVTNSKTFLYIRTYGMHVSGSRSLSLNEVVTGTVYSDSVTGISVNTWYYLRIQKIGLSFTCKVYTNSTARDLNETPDVDTLNLTFHDDWSFRNIYGVSSYNDGNSFQSDVDIEKLDLNEITWFLTFYNNSGGILRVDNVTISNGTQNNYTNNTVIELASLPQNSSYAFSHFKWNSSNATINPYNLTVTSNLTTWCYFEPIIPDVTEQVTYIGLIIMVFCIGIGMIIIVTKGDKKK